MLIANIQDAREVAGSLQAILYSTNADTAAQAIRTLFVETLDFDCADRLAPLNGAEPNLPSDARLLARRDGISALYVPLDEADGNHVTGATEPTAANVIGDTISDEPLLLFTSRDHDQLHVIYPDLSRSRPALRRMVAHREQPRRTLAHKLDKIKNLSHQVRSGPIGALAKRRAGPCPL